MGFYTSDREQARQDRAAALRHKKSILDRISYGVIESELDNIINDCWELMWFSDADITELMAQDGESDSEFCIIATQALRRRKKASKAIREFKC